MTDSHAVAQELSARAAVLAAGGDATGARALFRQAAEHEERALLVVATDKPRTRGIFAVSLVSLLYKAHDYPRAERWCHRLLADEGLANPARTQLRQLLEVTDERLLLDRDGREYVGDALTISMRGGLVGWGTAPLNATLEYGSAASAWIYRVASSRAATPSASVGARHLMSSRRSRPAPASRHRAATASQCA